MATCTGCSCLCDDIEADVSGGAIRGLRNACLKGGGLFRSHASPQRLRPAVQGRPAGYEAAVKAAADILRSAKHPLVYGLDTCTDAAQDAAIALARRLGAALDDPSSFCQGGLVSRLMDGSLPTCTLDQVRDEADVITYWGANPMDAQPRHLSRYTYYPRGARRQHGYSTDRSLLAVDVRRTDTAGVARRFYRVKPGGDAGVMAALTAALDGRAEACNLPAKEALEFANRLAKAEYPVVFCGLGLVHSLGGDFGPLEELAGALRARGVGLRVLAVGCNYNMRGVNEKVRSRTGRVGAADFGGGAPTAAMRLVAEGRVDAALVVGADPLSSWPGPTVRKLASLPMVAVDVMATPTTARARAALPAALSGVEAGGTATRIDGVGVRLDPPIAPPWPSDHEILRAITEAL